MVRFKVPAMRRLTWLSMNSYKKFAWKRKACTYSQYYLLLWHPVCCLLNRDIQANVRKETAIINTN